jgi:steroid delta-isomerase-like uncharacterized protein
MADNAAAASAMFDAWERRDFDGMGERLASGVSFNDAPGGHVVKGRDDVRDWYASWASAFPDGVAGATVSAASGDTVAVEGVLVGTNTGAFGSLPPAGKSISVAWANVLRFDSDGRVISGTAYYDMLTLMVQLGHAAPPS